VIVPPTLCIAMYIYTYVSVPQCMGDVYIACKWGSKSVSKARVLEMGQGFSSGMAHSGFEV
jgi:hypothetical protein